MKKICSVFILMLSGILFHSNAQCQEVAESSANGYCVTIYDANGGKTYQCLDPDGSVVTKNCKKDNKESELEW